MKRNTQVLKYEEKLNRIAMLNHHTETTDFPSTNGPTAANPPKYIKINTFISMKMCKLCVQTIICVYYTELTQIYIYIYICVCVCVCV
jgi:hypothetical protein